MENMFRVLQVIHSMNLGGAENFIMNVYRAIDREEIQFDFLVNTDGVFDQEIKHLGGRIWKIPYVSDVGPFQYHLALRKFFREHPEYQVIHSHLNMVSGEVISCAKKEHVKYCITHSHSTNTRGNIAVKLLKRYYQKKIKHSVDLCLACSEQAGRWLYENQTAIVIQNAIDIEKFRFQKQIRDEIRKRLDLSEHTIVIGHVGRFIEVKNHTFLIRVFAAYHKENPDSYLLLCGEGNKKQQAQSLVEELNLTEHVIFHDAEKDVYRMYQAMDAFVFPSLYEGMPLVMIEAQANGLPIVASSAVDEKSAITSNVQFVNLDAELCRWVESVKKALERGRMDECERLRKSGYDIRKTAETLTDYYKRYDNLCK